MAKIVAVHGIGMTFEGENTLKKSWLPALKDGLVRAGRALNRDKDLTCAFYGDLFRPKGKSAFLPPLDATDITDPLEREMLDAWWREAARIESQVPGPQDATKLWAPQTVQRALNALSHSKFFAGLAERVLIFDLKQVVLYLNNSHIREEAQAQVSKVVGPDTRVLIGHSLGSVIAYEAFCAHPEWPLKTFITLGSPLGIRNIIFEKLRPAPQKSKGVWPGQAERWVNIADRGDIVALEKQLATCFGSRVQDRLINNGARAHDVTRYLTAEETGDAIASGL